MRHQTSPAIAPVASQPAHDTAGLAAAGAELAAIARQLDARFMPAGATIAHMAETVGAVLAALDGATGAHGDSDPAQHLLTAAARLREVPARQAQRGHHVDAMLAITRHMLSASAEIARILSMLQFYTVNLKIAAAGAEEFVEFATDMGLKLVTGTAEVDAFKQQIAIMQASLEDMRKVDTTLAKECARVIPQVPDRLLSEVARMQHWQKSLAGATTGAREVVMRIQASVARALAAMQIGDIARQRLEHVEAAGTRLNAALADPAGLDPDGTRAHMLRMLAAHLDDMNDEFDAEAATLLTTLDTLGRDCRALLEAGRNQGGLEDSSRFLGELDTCVSHARGMTRQLDSANAKAGEITAVVVHAAERLRTAIEVFDNLRCDVDYMAINVNIRARRDSAIGKPVAVIAEEIRISSTALAERAQAIAQLALELGEASRNFGTGQVESGEAGVDAALSTALESIRADATRAETAMGGLAATAQDIAGMITSASAELAACEPIARRLRGIAGEFVGAAGDAIALPLADHPLTGLLDAAARSYSMASERMVHNRFLLPGMTAAQSAPPPAQMDDDDLLF